jgi:hypothetical protein
MTFFGISGFLLSKAFSGNQGVKQPLGGKFCMIKETHKRLLIISADSVQQLEARIREVLKR